MKKIFICSILLGLLGCSGLDKTMQLGDYNKIINRYSGSINKNDPELNFTVAEAYRKSNRIQEAVPFYKSALDHSYDEKYLAYYYARSLKANKQYDEARNVLQIHLEKTNETDVKKIMANEIQNLSSIEDLKKKETYFREKNLDAINTPFTEFGPVYNNGFLYFTSNREASKIYKATGTPFLDIYRVPTKGANVNLSLLEMLDPVINSPDINEGSVAFSADGLSLIYAKGNNGKATGNKEVNLYFTRYRNGQWLEPRPISVNDPESWDSTPSMSPDGQTLYFSSNRPGGFGGTDLYSAKLNRRGRWVDIRNLGPEINTPGDEMFPFISADGSLFFASDGHPGLGKLDIFRASRTSGLAQIENLGMPMNSEADDFGYFEFDLTRGFFSSNRKEGNGDDDIYTFINDDPNLKIVNYYLAGSTVTENDGGEEIIVSNSKVTLVSRDGTVLDETYTREDGQFRFRVFTEENYHLIGEKTDYFTTRKEFSTIGKSIRKDTLTEFVTNVEFKTKIKLDRIVIEKPIVLNNIYYDLDKADIRPDAALVLDSLVMIMNDNPEIYIELGSHTDARALDNYNLDLSWRRARSAVSYIISKGVNPNRITARGYGETQLINLDAQTEEEHQVNRRTEFKVLSYNPKERQEDMPDDEEMDEYDRFFKNNGENR